MFHSKEAQALGGRANKMSAYSATAVVENAARSREFIYAATLIQKNTSATQTHVRQTTCAQVHDFTATCCLNALCAEA